MSFAFCHVFASYLFEMTNLVYHIMYDLKTDITLYRVEWWWFVEATLVPSATTGGMTRMRPSSAEASDTGESLVKELKRRLTFMSLRRILGHRWQYCMSNDLAITVAGL